MTKQLGPAGKPTFRFRYPFISNLNYKHFLLITVLILILPLVREWRILMSGERLTGELVTPYEAGLNYSDADKNSLYRNVIRYEFQGRQYQSYASQYLDMAPGAEVPLLINPSRPHDYLIWSFRGFFLHRRSVVIVMSILVWLAIYSTLIQIQQGNIFSQHRY